MSMQQLWLSSLICNVDPGDELLQAGPNVKLLLGRLPPGARSGGAGECFGMVKGDAVDIRLAWKVDALDEKAQQPVCMQGADESLLIGVRVWDVGSERTPGVQAWDRRACTGAWL